MVLLSATPAITTIDGSEPTMRLARLLDPGSLRPVPQQGGSHSEGSHSGGSHPGGTAVTVAYGRIDGAEVVAFCTDASRRGGALGLAECDQITAAIDAARASNRPVIGVWHSGGANLADGVEAMHGIAKVFRAMVRASGKVPQISLVLGPAAGGAAYGPALTDIVIMAPAGRMFVTGPDVVRSVTGEDIDMAGLGGPGAHGAKSGVAHIIARSEADAFERARSLIGLLSMPGRVRPELAEPSGDPLALLPESSRRAYDVRPLIQNLLDGGHLEELHGKWAPNMVVGFGRLGGGTIGVIANNPLRKGGCLDSLSAEKAARFLRMCDALGIGVLVIVDVPGYLPGVDQEWGGVVRRGAKLLYAFAEARIPRVTLVTRKSYGGAYIAMNSRGLGANAVFAWPGAEVAVMSADAAVSVLHRKRLLATPEDQRETLRAQLVEEQQRIAGGVRRGLALGVIDEVVQPADTRPRLARAFAEAATARGVRGDHGNIPL